MLSIVVSVLSDTYYFIFEKETVQEQNLKPDMKLRINILGLSRKNEYFPKNATYRHSLQKYTTVSLRMTINKKFAQSLDIQDGDIANIEITQREWIRGVDEYVFITIA